MCGACWIHRRVALRPQVKNSRRIPGCPASRPQALPTPAKFHPRRVHFEAIIGARYEVKIEPTTSAIVKESIAFSRCYTLCKPPRGMRSRASLLGDGQPAQIPVAEPRLEICVGGLGTGLLGADRARTAGYDSYNLATYFILLEVNASRSTGRLDEPSARRIVSAGWSLDPQRHRRLGPASHRYGLRRFSSATAP
jgi:hypothetical protein